ncbi:hypothetical protein ACQ4M3_29235 [Leptolyngbya sp. AN03gr2]|uniref:hypothetical protein n=1 Tax=unclassified Leptolyngbya TaxID=2650499 RepID=UPI003D319CE0
MTVLTPTEHRFDRTPDKGYRCCVCLREWRSRSKTNCWGLPDLGMLNNAEQKKLDTRSSLAAKNLQPTGSAIAFQKFPGGILTLYYNKNQVRAIHHLPILDRSQRHSTELRSELDLKQLNLAPSDEARAAYWNGREWEYLYDQNEARIDDLTLPPIYPWDHRPAGLLTKPQLKRYNLKPSETSIVHGVTWNPFSEQWNPLYQTHDCAIADESLPPCYHKDNVPPGLVTLGWIKLHDLALKPGASPAACYRKWCKEHYYSFWDTILLYDQSECIPKSGLSHHQQSEPQPTDAVIGGQLAQPQPGDVVLGGLNLHQTNRSYGFNANTSNDAKK